MASVADALRRIKDNPLGIVDRVMIERACREHNYDWRDRELTPATTIALFLQQVVRGNVPCGEVRHIAATMDELPCRSFTAQAYCDARARLPLAVYQTLLGELHAGLTAPLSEAQHRWRGHRTFHVDGSTFSMPDTPQLQKAFGLPAGPKPGCGFPVAHLLALFSAATGMLIDTWASPLRTGDLAETPEAHMHLEEGDILIGDDSYSGYPHLAMLQAQNLHGLVPVHHLRIVDFKKGRPHCGEGNKAVAGMPRSRWIKSLGKEDQIVEYFKPPLKPQWMVHSPMGVAAGVDLRPRDPPNGRAAGTGQGHPHAGQHAAGRQGVSGGGVAGIASAPLGRGNQSPAPQDNAGTGRAAVQERTGRTQGTGHLQHRLQPGAGGDAGGGTASGGAGGADQFCRCVHLRKRGQKVFPVSRAHAILLRWLVNPALLPAAWPITS